MVVHTFTPALPRQRQSDLCEFKSILSMSCGPDRPGVDAKTLQKKKKKKSRAGRDGRQSEATVDKEQPEVTVPLRAISGSVAQPQHGVCVDIRWPC